MELCLIALSDVNTDIAQRRFYAHTDAGRVNEIAEIKFTADSDYKMMIKKALEESAANGNILLVTGSFYLVSEVKEFLNSI